MKKLLFALPAAALAGGYLGFRHACHRIEDPDWDSPEALKNTMYEEFAESTCRANQWLRDHDAETVEVRSFDGVTLRGQWVRAEKPIGTILLFHGYHTHYIHDFSGIFAVYRSLGLNLLLARQRGHGSSDGKYITFGVKERKDALAWIEYHNRVHGMDDLFLGGMSMGASTVLFAAGEDLPPNVRGIIADCGFTSPDEILCHIIRRDFHLSPKLILPLADIWARALGGFSFYECNTRKTLARSRTPILFIHGKADNFVPCYMTEIGYVSCASEKELCLVEGAGHGRSYLRDPERLKAALTDFLRRNLSDGYAADDPSTRT